MTSETHVPSSTAVRSALQPFVDAGDLAGAVALVADAQGTISLDAVGSADIAADRPMQADAMFWIASMTKSLTAAALMMLVEAGKVGLDDPVTRFLPEFADQWMIAKQTNDQMVLRKPMRPPTVSDLLTHTSGMPFTSAIEKPSLDLLPLRESVWSYVMTPLLCEPGTRYNYSNCGVNTEGRIIEVVSGMDYAAFLQKHLLAPLEMHDTTFWPNAEQSSRLAKTYRPNQATREMEETMISQLSYPLDNPRRQPMAAGGLFSTASDVARFCRMFLNGGTFEGQRYLSESTVREMTWGRTFDGRGGQVGLGWDVTGDTFSHSGALATNMTVVPQSNRVLVYLVQHEGFPRRGGEALGEFHKAALGTGDMKE